MSYARKSALAAAIVWAVILGGLIVTVLGTGVSRFTDSDQSLWRVLAAATILPGFLLNWWLIGKSRRARRANELDERDEAVARRASEVTLVVVAMLVYASSIVLYETHLDSGLVPTGWLYLIAYGTVALVSLVHAVATLIVDWSGTADG